MSDSTRATPVVKMYRCEGCGDQHPYSCQKIAAEQTAALRTLVERYRACLEEAQLLDAHAAEQTAALQAELDVHRNSWHHLPHTCSWCKRIGALLADPEGQG